jgi:molybdate transport system substrate-binding protein
MRTLLFLLSLLSFSAAAEDLRVVASNGVRASLEELAQAFIRETGHNVHIVFGLAATIKRNLEAGEDFDLAILTEAGIADLAKQGKVDAASITPIARSGVGIAIRAGSVKYKINTADDLKRTLRLAKSVTWAKEGASGVYFASVVEKLGLTEELKPKLNLAASGVEVGQKIVAGDAEIGALLINEIMALPGVEVLGPLPPELQSWTVFHAGVSAGSKNAAAAKTLAGYLTRPASKAVFKAKGQDPE